MRTGHLLHTVIAGYELTRHIGSGGMGEVYQAYHQVLGRVAAVKILYQKEHANRFRNEAYIQSGINHPNIARLYEFVHTGEYPCIIMEYVEGISLQDYIQQKGRIGSEETGSIIAQVAAALSYLHRQDIIHRDIKPANFKIQSDGTVKMLDFGIAKHRYTPRFTQEGFVVGTTEYMAPEQFEQRVDKSSDIWSLGVMTYEMITGYMPFDGSNAITVRSNIAKGRFTDPAILVTGISSTITTVIDRTLRIQTSSRATAEELERILQGKSIKPNKMKMPSLPSLSFLSSLPALPVFRLSRLYRSGTILYIGVSVMLAVLIVLFVANNSPEPIPTPPIDPVKPSAAQHKVKINVPSVDNAVIVFPDGRQLAAPYEISGKEGEEVAFTIKAAGYMDRKVTVAISHRRDNYEITLQKLNN